MEEKEYYDDDSYKDSQQKNPKKIIIIGSIVLGFIIILLLIWFFGFGRSKKPVDENNYLKNIIIEGGELEPAFNKDVLEYDLKTSSPTIRITCEKDSDNSTVSGCDLGELATADLIEDIVFTVTAANKEERKYVIRVNTGYEGIIVNVDGNDNEWSNGEVTLKINATGDNPLADEPYSFDNGKTWQKDNIKKFDSDQTVRIRVLDNQGNISIAKVVEIKIDKTEPTVEVTGTVPSGQVTDSAVTLNGATEPKETPSGYKYQWYNANVPIEGATESTYTTSNSGNYTLEVTTGAGNKARSNNYIISNKNSVKPIINGVSGMPNGWSNSDITIMVNATSQIGIADMGYSFDNGKTWQTTPSKTYSKAEKVNILVKDKNGNVSEVKIVDIRIDKNNPSVKITGSVVSGKTTNNNVKLTAVPSPSTTPSGYRYQWYKNSQAIKGATGKSYTATSSGSYMVRVTTGTNKTATSTNYSVNKTSSSSTGSVVITSVTGNSSAWTRNNVTLKVNAKATSGLHSQAYSFDNGKSWQSSSSKTFTSNQTVQIKVRDKYGKVSSVNKQVINKIDKIGPLVSFSPNGNTNYVKNVTTTITVSDYGVKSLGTLYFALSTSNTKQPNFSATFKSGNKIKIANGAGVYYLWIKATDSLGNTTITKSNAFRINDTLPDIQISAYRADSNQKNVGSALKTGKNTNVEISGWKNYGVNFVITASSKSVGIKSITWEWSAGGKNSYNAANTSTAWKSGGKSVYNQSSKTVNFSGNGVRLGKVTVTDKAGNSRTVRVRADIDTTAPTVSFKVVGTKYSNGYYSGAIVQAICTDSLSGITYMYTYDNQDTSDKITYNGSAVTSKTHGIKLLTRGQTRNITTICKDKVGNSTGNKKSPTYKIY